jgi:integrase
VEKARDRARKLLQAVREGGDPLADKTKASKALTVRELGELYLTRHAEAKKRPSSVKADKQNLKNHVYPALGNRAAIGVTRADIEKLHGDMKATPGAANRTLALLSKMLNLSEAWGIRPEATNPCRHVERYPEHEEGYYLSADESERLGEALAEAERTQIVSRVAIAAIRMLIFTGCRPSEIIGLRWEEIDRDNGFLRLGATRSKTGEWIGAKFIHLSPPALEVLSGLKPYKARGATEPNPFVFYGRKNGSLGNLRRPWATVREKAGLPVHVRLYDLRHSFASTGGAGGLSLPIIGKLLGHTSPRTTQRYVHFASDPLRQATAAIGGRIAAAMAGSKGNVVEIAARKGGKRNRRG